MAARPISELREADGLTLAFGPLGFGGQMRPEDSAEFLQRLMARHELAPAVPDSTRRSFDQLRNAFAYGLFCYDIFTLVNDRALLVFEQALRERFIGFHQGTVTFIDPQTGQGRPVAADRYEQVQDFTSRHRGWRLRVGDGPDAIAFNGMLGGLREWARHAGLLRGQRNRGIENAISSLRNNAAHPSAYEPATPVEAVTTISDLAEIINHLWGSSTPGGRLYPAPVQRTAIVVSWNEEAGSITFCPVAPGHPAAWRKGGGIPRPGGAGPGEAGQGWQHLLVRGVPDDWDLMNFDARYETGRYPAEWLWGPGSAEQAAAWGTWYVVKADSPEAAFSHQRQSLAGGFGCAARGACANCPVQALGHGSWKQAMALLAAAGVAPAKVEVPDVRVSPALTRRSRCIRIIVNGGWEIAADEIAPLAVS